MDNKPETKTLDDLRHHWLKLLLLVICFGVLIGVILALGNFLGDLKDLQLLTSG